MTHLLFVVKREEDGLFPLGGQRVNVLDLPPGAMWECDCHDGRGWLIMLPGVVPWCTLARTASGPWAVSGEVPKLTVQPSINVHGGWHGWISDGVISDPV